MTENLQNNQKLEEILKTQEVKISERDRESYKKECKQDVKSLIEDWHIAEEEWITSEMFEDKTEEGKKKMEYYKKNKLRGNWFYAVGLFCLNMINIAIDDSNLKQELQKECQNLRIEVYTAKKETGGTNRGLVEKAETLMKKIERYL